MEQYIPEPDEQHLCVNCNTHPFVEGYPTKLCTDCRNSFIKFPIPKWIYIVGIVVLGAIVISLARIPNYAMAAIHLGRGEKAIESRYFLTAQRELAKTLEKFPDDITANANMVIASSYNFDFEATKLAYGKIEGKKLDDDELYAKVNSALDKINIAITKDSVMANKITAAKLNKDELLLLYQQVDTTDDVVLKAKIADFLYDLKDYAASERVSMSALKTSPNFPMTLQLLSAVKREQGEYEQALAYCDSLLNINKEYIFAISQKTRIELKRKHDKQAAIYAAEAMQIDPVDDSALEALALVDHFAGRKKESLADLSIIKKHTMLTHDSTIYNRVNAVLNGSVVYR